MIVALGCCMLWCYVQCPVSGVPTVLEQWSNIAMVTKELLVKNITIASQQLYRLSIVQQYLYQIFRREQYYLSVYFVNDQNIKCDGHHQLDN